MKKQPHQSHRGGYYGNLEKVGKYRFVLCLFDHYRSSGFYHQLPDRSSAIAEVPSA